MTKAKRSGAESKQNLKPFLDIRVYEPVIKKFTITKESEQTLQAYTRFKNEKSGLKKITEDSILDALISKLYDDQMFCIWESNEAKSEKNEVNIEVNENQNQ